MSTSSTNNRNRTLMIAGGLVGVLALCVCALAGLGAAGYYFYQRQGSGPTTAQQPAVEYILDASPRMAQPTDGGTRLELARGILAEVVRPADAQVTAGLRVFGNGTVAQPCQDTNLLVPLAASNQTKIADAATTLEAGSASDAAMAEAMVNAIRDLANTKGPHTLVVITGGKDDCQAQAGEIIKAEAARAGITLEEFVVGFQLSTADSDAVKSLVAASSDGVATYLDAPDADTLHNILSAIQAHVDQPVAVPIAVIQQAATPGAVQTLPTPVPNTAVPQGTAGAGGATSVPVGGFTGQTACDHPYMPVRPGSTWTYTVPSGTQTWTVENVSGDQNEATATVEITQPQGSSTYYWLCTAEGIRIHQAVNFAGANGGVSFDVKDENGVTLPAADKLVPGYSWNHGYTLTATMQGIAIDTIISYVSTAGPIVPTPTDFGTFDSIILTNAQSITTTGLGQGQTITATENIQFAKGVGIIHYDRTSQVGDETSTLTSYHIP